LSTAGECPSARRGPSWAQKRARQPDVWIKCPIRSALIEGSGPLGARGAAHSSNARPDPSLLCPRRAHPTSLPPMATDPDVAVTMPGPPSPDPNGVRVWANRIMSPDPHPTPSNTDRPISRSPSVFWPRGNRDYFDLRRGRSFGHDRGAFRGSRRRTDHLLRRGLDIFHPALNAPGGEGGNAEGCHWEPSRFHMHNIVHFRI